MFDWFFNVNRFYPRIEVQNLEHWEVILFQWTYLVLASTLLTSALLYYGLYRARLICSYLGSPYRVIKGEQTTWGMRWSMATLVAVAATNFLEFLIYGTPAYSALLVSLVVSSVLSLANVACMISYGAICGFLPRRGIV